MIFLAANVNAWLTLQIRVQVNCPNDYIVDMPTLTPYGMNHSAPYQYPNTNNTWTMDFRWMPRLNQTGKNKYFERVEHFLRTIYLLGVHPFCVGAIDNEGLATAHYCVVIAVGASATNIPTAQQTIFVQGTWSPMGTVMPTQRRFSIQSKYLLYWPMKNCFHNDVFLSDTANVPLKRPVRNGSQIRIQRSDNGNWAWWADCRFSPDVYYINNTIVFYARTATWVPGLTYYITLTEGVATSDQACGVESGTLWSKFNS